MPTHSFTIDGILFEAKKNTRARRLTMSLKGQDKIAISLPAYVPYKAAEIFAKTNISWVHTKLSQIKKQSLMPPVSTKEISHLRQKTRELVRNRLVYFNQFYGHTYNRITIRDQHTRWGSCSSSKTLSFNYKIGLLPPELADYIIVHELCHLKEMNHSHRFWALVSRTIPHYRKHKRDLKHYEL